PACGSPQLTMFWVCVVVTDCAPSASAGRADDDPSSWASACDAMPNEVNTSANERARNARGFMGWSLLRPKHARPSWCLRRTELLWARRNRCSSWAMVKPAATVHLGPLHRVRRASRLGLVRDERP